MLNLKDLRRRVRSRLDDTVAPYLWTTAEIDDNINDTLIDASIRANLTVQDDLQIPLTQTGGVYNNKYALSPGVLDVRSVRMQSDLHFTLRRDSIHNIETRFAGRPDYAGKPYSYALDLTMPGTGENIYQQVRAIYLISTPNQADTILLDISRLPCKLVTEEDIPEIDYMYQADLVFGVTALCYLKRDADTFDPKKSAEDFALFTQRFGERLPAAVLRQRQTEAPLQMIVGSGNGGGNYYGNW